MLPCLNVPKETNATDRCCQNGHGVTCRGLREIFRVNGNKNTFKKLHSREQSATPKRTEFFALMLVPVCICKLCQLVMRCFYFYLK